MLLNFSFLLPCSCLSTATRQRRINLEKWTWSLIFVNTDSSADGMRGVDVACVRLFFFSFSDDGVEYPYALVHWFSRVGDSPDEHTACRSSPCYSLRLL
ncbi:hypothetical protein BGY98DRAFT_223879 [Russula aff. rugulosa BPL654]|nr:hypothetical protein BGY98DRAFT_223879 [Russula aff. rugulosa BPL654]